jgi:hypothetical protein
MRACCGKENKKDREKPRIFWGFFVRGALAGEVRLRTIEQLISCN